MNSSSGDLSEYFILNRPHNSVHQDGSSSPSALRNHPDRAISRNEMTPCLNRNISRTTQSNNSPSYSDVSQVSSSSSRSHCQLALSTSLHFSDSGYSTPSSSPSYSSLSLPYRINSKCNYKKYSDYIAEGNLREDSSLNRRSTTGRSTTWFFLLQLLIDPTKKSVIAWTGNGMEFRIFDHIVLTSLWNCDNTLIKKTSWETLKRNIRTAYQKDILRPTSARNKMYAFLIEPSAYVGMTRKLLRIYIALNNINGPLTTGSPISFALPASTFPRGNRLQINRPIPLRDDGSPKENCTPEYINITLFEEDLKPTSKSSNTNSHPSKSHISHRSPIGSNF